MERKLTRAIDNIEDDIIRIKRGIEDRLLQDADIITALHNEDIGYAEDRRTEYLGVNILPFVRIPHTQDRTRNFICYKVDDVEESQRNDVMKVQYISFVVMVHADDVDTPWGMKRHDLLGYLIKDIFGWSNMFGMQLKCISNHESVMDTNYQCRTLVFSATKTNALHRQMRNNRFEADGILGRKYQSSEDMIYGRSNGD